jgi:hypothetical protein
MGKKATDNPAFTIHHSEFTIVLQPLFNDPMSQWINESMERSAGLLTQ